MLGPYSSPFYRRVFLLNKTETSGLRLCKYSSHSIDVLKRCKRNHVRSFRTTTSVNYVGQSQILTSFVPGLCLAG